MALYRNLAQAEAALRQFAGSRKAERMAIIAGHHRINALFEPAVAPEKPESFGHFPIYTAKLGLELAQEARKNGTDAKIVLLVDDHSAFPMEYYLEKYDNDGLAQTLRSNMGKMRADYVLKLPGEIVSLGIICEVLCFSEACRGNVFWESQYRRRFNEEVPGEFVGCAAEMNLVYQELSRQGFQNIIAFIPNTCRVPVCHAATRFNLALLEDKTLARQKRKAVFLSSESWTRTREDIEAATTKELGGIYVHTE
jgi:hypothetical protein